MPGTERHGRHWLGGCWRAIAVVGCLIIPFLAQARGATVAPCLLPEPAQSAWSAPLLVAPGANSSGAVSSVKVDPVAPCSTADRGKLLGLDPFGGKMLDHALRDPNGTSDGVVFIGDVPGPDETVPGAPGIAVNGAGELLAPQPQPPGSAGRRIMWRQIQ